MTRTRWPRRIDVLIVHPLLHVSRDVIGVPCHAEAVFAPMGGVCGNGLLMPGTNRRLRVGTE